ncbi:MAG: hypothetical protein EBR28_12990 [Planctomycetia bacterium]|nr:hypothetical protein [Planctomycetia bacterium]
MTDPVSMAPGLAAGKSQAPGVASEVLGLRPEEVDAVTVIATGRWRRLECGAAGIASGGRQVAGNRIASIVAARQALLADIRGRLRPMDRPSEG